MDNFPLSPRGSLAPGDSVAAFIEVLNDPKGCAVFMRFLEEQRNTENLLFWLEVYRVL